MKKDIYFLLLITFSVLFCGPDLAKASNSCDGVDISFDKQAFTSQAINSSLSEAAKTAKANGGTAQEIICASVSLEGVSTGDIVTALRSAGFDSVMIKIAAKATGLDTGEVTEALVPEPTTPAPLPTSVGLTPGKNASPNTP